MADNGLKKAKLGNESFTTVNNYIDNQYVEPKTGKYMDVTSPHDGAVIGKVALSDASDVEAAVESASKAFVGWSALTVKSRVQILIRFHQLMVKHADELADIIVLEHGKNKAEALGDVHKGNETVEYALSMPQLIQGKFLEVSRGVTCRDERRPLGVVTSIVPFNFPAMVPLWTLPIAIACGNTYILKPSEKVPLTVNRMVQLLKEAGLPDGVVNVVHGTVEPVTSLIDHPKVQGVTFVGSTKVAQIVARRARALDKKVLALGGAKNHLVTMPDCNIDMASLDIVNSFCGCTGQRCMAASVLLTVGKQKELIEAVVTKASSMIRGTGPREIGPVIDTASQQRIINYIDDSEKRGAEILLDGRDWAKKYPEGSWVGPTVILHKNKDDPALHEEIFGPVISIYQVATKEEAVAIENANEYGNAAAVYTTIGEHADWFQQRFSAGMIGINVGVPVPREPFSFGGINASKFGDFDITGDGGMEFFTKRIKVTTKWNPPLNRTWMD